MKYIALGGGGFSITSSASLIDEYIINSTSFAKPRICFIPTASGDSKNYIERYYQAFSQLNCDATHLALFKRTVLDLREFIINQDILYVGGGNTANLIAVWQAQGMIPIMKEFSKGNKVIAGISAGAACWFDWCLTDSFSNLNILDCIGSIRGGFCPHYNSEPDRQAFFPDMVKHKRGGAYAVEDGAALVFSGDSLSQVVSERKDAKAFYMEAGDSFFEKTLNVNYLF